MAVKDTKQVYEYPLGLDGDPIAGANTIMFFVNDTENTSSPTQLKSSGRKSVVNGEPAIKPDEASVSHYLNKTIRQKHVIHMYMPDSLEYSSGVNWSREELGNVGNMAKFLGATGESVKGQSLQGTMETLAKDNFAQKFNSEITGAAIETLGNLSSFAGVNIQETAEKISRTTKNNQMEVLFKGVEGRTFNFNFKFTPESPEEARQVRDIIYLFRFYMHPELTGGEDIGRYINYPAEFQIQFRTNVQQGPGGAIINKENTSVPKIGSCALVNASPTYGPTEFSTFDDELSLPTEIDLSLEFMEMDILNRRRIEEGF